MKNFRNGSAVRTRLGRKGFTLLELIVVVLIIAVLSAMAMPVYFKVVERTRMMEAVNALTAISISQQRKYIQVGAYAGNFRGLDIALDGKTSEDGTKHYPKGKLSNGFEIALSPAKTFADGFATATRQVDGAADNPELQYQYHLTRFYASDFIQCYGDNARGQELCGDYCSKDTPQAKCCSNGMEECPAPVSGNETSAHY